VPCAGYALGRRRNIAAGEEGPQAAPHFDPTAPLVGIIEGTKTDKKGNINNVVSNIKKATVISPRV